MQTIIENRASAILYNVIISNNLNKGKFLLPANICPIVPSVLFKGGTEFEFYDINNTDFMPDLSELIDIVLKDDNISSVLYNHTYGFENNPDFFLKKIKKINQNIFIINDSCLTKPVTSHFDTLADVTLFSTGYSKYVDFGTGGYAFVQDTVKYERTDTNYDDSKHSELVNLFNEVLKTGKKFEYIDSQWLDTREPIFNKENYFKDIKKTIPKVEKYKKNLNSVYENTIKKEFQINNKYNNWRFNIFVKNKNFVLSKIFEAGLFAGSHYQSLVGIFGKGNGKNAQSLHSKVINLFNDFRFTEEQAFKVSEIVNKYAK